MYVTGILSAQSYDHFRVTRVARPHSAPPPIHVSNYYCHRYKKKKAQRDLEKSDPMEEEMKRLAIKKKQEEEASCPRYLRAHKHAKHLFS